MEPSPLTTLLAPASRRPERWERLTAWFNRHAAAAYIGGTAGDLRDLLHRGGFRVSPRYLLRFASLLGASAVNSIEAHFEHRRHARAIAETTIQPPIFVLGHWRSGTTHLHNLLSLDDRFAYPNTIECCYPRTFLSKGRAFNRAIGVFMSLRRPMDNMAIRPDHPQEDEFAIFTLTRLSVCLSWVYPSLSDQAERYLTLADATDAERERWSAALRGFLAKLTLRYGRPLILKSPPHMGKLRLLLRMFPEARFVHVHRHPLEVFRSTRHMMLTAGPCWQLQPRDARTLDETVLRRYEILHRAYFDERGLIPQDRFCEVGYEELAAEPVDQLRRVYDRLNLGEFSRIEPRLRQYLETLKGYRTNRFEEPSLAIRQQVAARWRRSFEEWGYRTHSTETA